MLFVFKIMYTRIPFNSDLLECDIIYKNEIVIYTFKNISAVAIEASILRPVNLRKGQFEF